MPRMLRSWLATLVLLSTQQDCKFSSLVSSVKEKCVYKCVCVCVCVCVVVVVCVNLIAHLWYISDVFLLNFIYFTTQTSLNWNGGEKYLFVLQGEICCRFFFIPVLAIVVAVVVVLVGLLEFPNQEFTITYTFTW